MKQACCQLEISLVHQRGTGFTQEKGKKIVCGRLIGSNHINPAACALNTLNFKVMNLNLKGCSTVDHNLSMYSFSGIVPIAEAKTVCAGSEKFYKMCESNEVGGNNLYLCQTFHEQLN